MNFGNCGFDDTKTHYFTQSELERLRDDEKTIFLWSELPKVNQLIILDDLIKSLKKKEEEFDIKWSKKKKYLQIQEKKINSGIIKIEKLLEEGNIGLKRIDKSLEQSEKSIEVFSKKLEEAEEQQKKNQLMLESGNKKLDNIEMTIQTLSKTIQTLSNKIALKQIPNESEQKNFEQSKVIRLDLENEDPIDAEQYKRITNTAKTIVEFFLTCFSIRGFYKVIKKVGSSIKPAIIDRFMIHPFFNQRFRQRGMIINVIENNSIRLIYTSMVILTLISIITGSLNTYRPAHVL